MLDDNPADESTTATTAPESPTGEPTAAPDQPEAPKKAAKRAPRKAAGEAPAKKAAAKKAPAKRAARKTAEAPEADADAAAVPAAEEPDGDVAAAPVKKAAARKTTARKTTAKKAAKTAAPAPDAESEVDVEVEVPADADVPSVDEAADEAAALPTMLLFKAPETTKAPARRTRKAAQPRTEPEQPALLEAAEPAVDEAPTGESTETAEAEAQPDVRAEKKSTARSGSGRTAGKKRAAGEQAEVQPEAEPEAQPEPEDEAPEGDDGEGGGGRRRRRRGGRRRRKGGDGENGDQNGEQAGDEQVAEGTTTETSTEAEQEESAGEGTSRRRRRRRRSGDGGDSGEEPENTVTRVRRVRTAEDEITAISGSTRLEAKKQRRRDGREAGRRRAPIVSEAEFLARRESVDRVMVIRQREDLTQIAVLEDKVLVEHYVARESQTSLIGNVYLGRVQNVLPSMEAAFVDIGKGRNAVLYAGEVNWSALGHRDGQPRKIESVLSSGQPILVQVTKDPIGHKGARLTSQISLAGRFLVYVPDGTTSGISRKLPDTERNRLKTLLKEIVPDSAGVIVRTAAEGATEEELTRDVERLKARWEDIEAKTKGNAPQLLYGEPDLTLKVVRDLFTEDFTKLVIEGDDAWDTVQGYVAHVAPDLQERLERFERGDNGRDAFAAYRIDEQIAKGLDRKVWLPSGGSLVIDRTEAMTVVDVNTGKFTGSGGNLEETVTKNNLEAAEEIVRQLRLRDIGGIIVVDFIDMVLESNRDLVLRRLVECLGRDRTRHQVAEVTSLGLVQMTRKRIGTGLLESFSENCSHCQGRGVVIHDAPVEPRESDDGDRRGARRSRGGKGRGQDDSQGAGKPVVPSPKDIAAVARPENADKVADGQEQRAQQDEQPTARQEPEQEARQDDRQGGRQGGQRSRRRGREAPAAEDGAAAAGPAAETAPSRAPAASSPSPRARSCPSPQLPRRVGPRVRQHPRPRPPRRSRPGSSPARVGAAPVAPPARRRGARRS